MDKLTTSAREFLPADQTIPSLRKTAKNCQGCHLYKHASGTVFGLGNERAKLMLVGEMPGDKEDKAGEPFVGPAGILLHKIIEEAGVKWEDVYRTNVVKHFKFDLIKNRRVHHSPVASEIKC